MPQKYRALQTVSLVYKIIAVLVLLGGLIFGGLTTIMPTAEIDYSQLEIEIIYGPPATATGLGIIAGAALIALSLFAFGEMLILLVDLEANTRTGNALLNRILKQSASIERLPAKEDELPEIPVGSLFRKQK